MVGLMGAAEKEVEAAISGVCIYINSLSILYTCDVCNNI